MASLAARGNQCHGGVLIVVMKKSDYTSRNTNPHSVFLALLPKREDCSTRRREHKD
jgi:hypothetical protein